MRVAVQLTVKRSLRAVGAVCSLLLAAKAVIAAEPSPKPPGVPCETPAAAKAVASPSGAPDVAPPAPKTTAAEVAIFAHLGIATPVGGGGISLDVMPVPLLAIQAGVGTNGEGPEFEAGLRLRLPISKSSHFTVGSGWSTAHYTGHDGNGLLAGSGRVFEGIGENTHSYAVWEHAHFWNNELGGEERYRHLLARYYVGYAALLNRSAYACTEGYWPCQPKASNMILYAGLAFGYAF